MEEKESSSFFLTIYPTIDCNLRCWYCYESHENNACMDNDTVLKVRKLIRNVICRKKIKNLFLSFFGGEPLLRFEEIVKPFISYTRDMCKDHNVDLYIDITSNGVLMTDDVINDLLSLELNNTPLFQITLDGNRKEHNKVKFTKNGRGTYDIIINNIKNALKAGIPINNRLNYTQKNIDSLIDVLDEYSELTKEERKNLFVDFQQVWQDASNQSARNKALKLASLYRIHSCQVRMDKRLNRGRCNNDMENQATINYNGLVYKCTAIDFKSDNAEGKLKDDGTIEWNNRCSRRMEYRFGNSNCHSCKIFPICHGGCSQVMMDGGNINSACLLGYSEDDKNDIIKKRIEYILENRKAVY